MKKQTLTEELTRMRKLAGIQINELQYFHNGAEGTQFINYDDEDITDNLEALGMGSMDGRDFEVGEEYEIGDKEYKLEKDGDNFKLVVAENLSEATDQIPGKDNIVILVSDYAKKHIMTHNKPGAGSVFKTGISEDDIIKMVTDVSSKVSGDGGAYELKQSGIGYDLVLPMEKAKSLKDAKEGEVEKQEGPNKVKVPSITTSQPTSDFSTDRISLIIRKSNPQFLPDDVKKNEDINKKIEEGKCYSLLTAFPGNPDIPRASEWNGKYAVVIPGSSKEVKENIFKKVDKILKENRKY